MQDISSLMSEGIKKICNIFNILPMDRQARVMIFLPLPLIGGEVVGRPGVAVVKVIVNKEMRKKVKERCKEAMVGERENFKHSHDHVNVQRGKRRGAARFDARAAPNFHLPESGHVSLVGTGG